MYRPAAAVFVTFRSALRLTVVDEVELLLPLTGSAVALLAIEAVLLSVPPSAKPGPMWTVIVCVPVAPLARPALVQVTVPEALTQPADAETKLVPAGTASVSV